MEYKLSKEERTELISLLPFHGEIIYLKIFNDFRNHVGFTEEEVSEWEKIEVKVFEIGDNLRKQAILQLELINPRTDLQEELYQKLK